MLRDDIFQKKPGDYREEIKLALKDIERVVDFQKGKCHKDKQEVQEVLMRNTKQEFTRLWEKKKKRSFQFNQANHGNEVDRRSLIQ